MLESRIRSVNAIQRLWWVNSAIYMNIGERMGGRERENARTQTQNTQKDKQTNNKQAQFYIQIFYIQVWAPIAATLPMYKLHTHLHLGFHCLL